MVIHIPLIVFHPVFCQTPCISHVTVVADKTGLPSPIPMHSTLSPKTRRKDARQKVPSRAASPQETSVHLSLSPQDTASASVSSSGFHDDRPCRGAVSGRNTAKLLISRRNPSPREEGWSWLHLRAAPVHGPVDSSPREAGVGLSATATTMAAAATVALG